MFAFVSLVYGVLAIIFWCYIRFAIWLTKADEEEAADQRYPSRQREARVAPTLRRSIYLLCSLSFLFLPARKGQFFTS